MIISDFDLRNYLKSRRLIIEPLSDNSIQQNGIDFKLSDEMAIGKVRSDVFAIPAYKNGEAKKSFEMLRAENGMFLVPAKTNILFSTREFIKVPSDLMGFCGLRSTFARWGFLAPLTIIDAGFEGTLTIETFYGGETQIRIPVGTRFLHVVFSKLTSPVEKVYDGVYKYQKGVRLPKPVD